MKLLHFFENGEAREPEYDFEEAGFLLKVEKAGVLLLIYSAGL